MTPSSSLPLVLAGPVLRRLEPQRLAIWLACTQPLQPEFTLDCPGITPRTDCQVIPVGKHAYLHLLDIHFAQPLPCNVELQYDVLLGGRGIADWAEHLAAPQLRAARTP